MLKKALPLAVAFSLMFSQTIFALSRTDYNNDLKYYEKVSRTKKLTPNDKLYILHKLKNKYKGTSIDTSYVESEISRLSREKKGGLAERALPSEEKEKIVVSDEKEEKTAVKTVSEEGKITDITLGRQDNRDAITIHIMKPKKVSSYLLTDPKARHNPKIVVDIEEATESVQFKKKDFDPGVEGIKRIKVGLYQEKPIPIVRVIVDLSSERKHKLQKKKDRVVLLVESARKMVISKKDKQEASKPDKVPVETPAKEPEDINLRISDIEKSYKIVPGDLISVEVAPQKDVSKKARVDEKGFIHLKLGKVKVSGKNAPEAKEAVRKLLLDYLRKPSIKVTILEFGTDKVFTIGHVNIKSELPFKENITMYDWLKSNGGFKYTADLSNIVVHRNILGRKTTVNVDLEELIRIGEEELSPVIKPGDIIEVGGKETIVSIIGEVEKPGRYEIIDENYSLLKLLAGADGHTKNAYLKRIIVARTKEDGSFKRISLNLRSMLSGKRGKDFELKPGDIVYIPRKR